MISFRQADLLPQMKKTLNQINEGDTVMVQAAGPSDSWSGAFQGIVDSHTGQGDFFFVKDNHGNTFTVSRDQMQVVPVQQPKVHSSVSVNEPGKLDDWQHGFTGHVTEIDKTVEPVQYHVQDQEENVFVMTRDRFTYPAFTNNDIKI